MIKNLKIICDALFDFWIKYISSMDNIIVYKRYKIIPIYYWYDAYVSSEAKVRLSNINININTENGLRKMSIYNTPHYIFINDYLNKATNKEQNIYKNYKQTYFSDDYNKDRVDTFLSMADDIKNDISNNELKVKVILKKKIGLTKNTNYLAIDGAHRLAILASLDIEYATCMFLNCNQEKR